MKRLVLFDIDGTLLRGGRLWRECFEGAFRHCFPGRDFPKVPFSGKTDRQICREMLEPAGFTGQRLDDATDGALNEYLARVACELAGRADEVELLPGVREILDSLQGMNGVTLGLLTGNIRRGAELKLGSVGLAEYFEFGAFGDDHWDRYELPPIAVRRAHEICGIRFQGKEVVIIGDTEHDVSCGKSIGVRAIAVGTGKDTHRDAILAACPDAFFDDLSQTQSVIEAILR